MTAENIDLRGEVDELRQLLEAANHRIHSELEIQLAQAISERDQFHEALDTVTKQKQHLEDFEIADLNAQVFQLQGV